MSSFLPRTAPELAGIFIVAMLAVAGCESEPQNRSTELTAAAGAADNIPEQASYIGGEVCTDCHAAQAEGWRDSHHDLAMQLPTPETVLGDFSNTGFSFNNSVTTFSRLGDRFVVTTGGPGGELRDYDVKYVFGVAPLQQYLLELPGGRLQALSIAWDSRPAEQGGQRWFHIYPGEDIDHTDELHWTKVSQNWNFMCAECHSTNLQKNYDAAARTYATTFSDIDVSCEACHGPGSVHVQVALERDEAAFESPLNGGLSVDFRPASAAAWHFNEGDPIASLAAPRETSAMLGVCAQCHSRRTTIRSDAVHQETFLDSHRLSLLEADLYHSDGQIDDEVYVYGSFLQSKMHAAGVTCNDCHDPHSLKLRAAGNTLCATCHAPAVYDTTEHHLHPQASEASQCVACHMPTKNYMVVDARRDHSFRIPRPDLTTQTGAPDVCSGCHQDRSADWAADIIAAAKRTAPEFHFGEALAAARAQQTGAKRLLQTVARDTDQPAIARATALSLLGAWPAAESRSTLRAGLNAPDPLVRIGALEGLAGMPVQERYTIAGRLLSDPVRSVRVTAMRQLAGINRRQLTASQQREFAAAVQEYIEVQNENADRAFAHTNLGNLYVSLGETARARAEYEIALEIEPQFMPGYVNLADYFRATGAEADAERVLNAALAVNRAAAGVHHALGLAKVRQADYAAALQSLGEAVELEPDNHQFIYVYAIALASKQQRADALLLLEDGHVRWPANRPILSALMTLNAESGNPDAALVYGNRLLELTPEDQGLQQFLRQLGSAPN